jgi:leucyl aminopeptidase
MDGTTVAVLNTDAEGRLILADALAYAKRYQPELVIDLATLTGAAARAIGKNAAIAMGVKSEQYMPKLLAHGFTSGDRLVEFPMWEEYKEDMKSNIADLKNIGSGDAGMITAAKFLEHFTDYPYIHIDIAGPAFLTSAWRYHPIGATGAGVRVLYSFFKEQAEL